MSAIDELVRNADSYSASFEGAHLEGADLSLTGGLDQQEIDQAHGDALTVLPETIVQPAHWKRLP